jgi:hypothetical protein
MDNTNRRVRIDRLLWRFRERIELKPLPAAQCVAIHLKLTQGFHLKLTHP